MFIFIVLRTYYLYTDAIKSNMQEKIRYKDRRLQKGLVVPVDIYISIHDKWNSKFNYTWTSY